MTTKLKYIDALRGLAILGVIVGHCAMEITDLPKWFQDVTFEGARGVQLFFVLSALTLFLSMESRSKKGDTNLNFFIRRFFRIAPIFYLGLLFYPLMGIVSGDLVLKDLEIGNILGTLTFIINGFNPYWINSLVPGGWSITVEMTFYLFVPLLFKVIKNEKKAITFTVITFVTSLVLNILLENLNLIQDINIWEHYLFYWFPNQLPVFSLGMLLYFVLKNNKKIISLSPNLLIGISFSLMIILSLISVPFINHILYGVVFVILAYALSFKPIKLIVNKFMMNIGKVSFSMYLVHFFVLGIIHLLYTKLNIPFNGILKFTILFVFTTLVSIIVSNLSYNVVEKQGIKLGNFLISRTQMNSSLPSKRIS